MIVPPERSVEVLLTKMCESPRAPNMIGRQRMEDKVDCALLKLNNRCTALECGLVLFIPSPGHCYVNLLVHHVAVSLKAFSRESS